MPKKKKRISKISNNIYIYKLIRALQVPKNHTIVWLLPTIGNHQSWCAQLLSFSLARRANERTHIAHKYIDTPKQWYISYCKETEIARSLTIMLMLCREHGVRVLSFHAAHNHSRPIQTVRIQVWIFLNITKLFLTYHDRNRIQGGGAGICVHSLVRMNICIACGMSNEQWR